MEIKAELVFGETESTEVLANLHRCLARDDTLTSEERKRVMKSMRKSMEWFGNSCFQQGRLYEQSIEAK